MKVGDHTPIIWICPKCKSYWEGFIQKCVLKFDSFFISWQSSHLKWRFVIVKYVGAGLMFRHGKLFKEKGIWVRVTNVKCAYNELLFSSSIIVIIVSRPNIKLYWGNANKTDLIGLKTVSKQKWVRSCLKGIKSQRLSLIKLVYHCGTHTVYVPIALS